MNKEEMLIKAKQAVNDQIERIESGEPIFTGTDNENNTVVVKKNTVKDHNGNEVVLFGYILYRYEREKPFCYFESTEYFTDFKKRTSNNGYVLGYTDAKAVIERNLTGQFTEYVREQTWDSYNVFYKSEKADAKSVTSSVHGFERKTDPTQLLYIDFYCKQINIAAGAHTVDGKTVSIDHANLKADGTPDYEEMYEWLLDEMRVERVFSDTYRGLSEEAMKAVASRAVKDRVNFLNTLTQNGTITPPQLPQNPQNPSTGSTHGDNSNPSR